MTDAPAEIVRQFLKDMERLDFEAGARWIAEDCQYTNPPPLGAVQGPQGVRAVLEPFFAPTLENEFRILSEATNGATVFVERLDRHRLPDKWVELPVTGVLEVRDGKITRWTEYFDVATIMSQWPTG